MGITYGDHLIDSGHHDITPEQEREIWAREECVRRGIDPDEICADGGVTAWMVVAAEIPKSASQIGIDAIVRLAILQADEPADSPDFSDFEEQCPNCGGDGVVYMCLDEIGCVDPEGGCDMCERRCDWCRPKPAR